MVTIQVERDGVFYSVVWDDGELAGDLEVLEQVETMIEVGTTFTMTPTGPILAVSKATPHTIIRALEDFGAVAFQGDLPSPPWETFDDVDY